jgi:hypothetical protein
LGKDEVEGILDYPVTVQEKIDGANASVWIEDGEIKVGSRNHEVPEFEGLKQYVLSHDGIMALLDECPQYRLFGEWLIKHTLQYDQDSYKHFYLFDVYDHEWEQYISQSSVDALGDYYDIRMPKMYIHNTKCTEEDIMKHVGKSSIGDKGEGVVIKAEGFVNRFGDYPAYAKIVTPEFMEKNALTFGNGSKDAQNCIEMKLCADFITPARVKKIVQKIESQEDRPLALSDCPRIGDTVYHDFIEEEAWSSMAKKNKRVCFRTLGHLCKKRAIMIFKGMLNGEDVSIAFKEVSEE